MSNPFEHLQFSGSKGKKEVGSKLAQEVADLSDHNDKVTAEQKDKFNQFLEEVAQKTGAKDQIESGDLSALTKEEREAYDKMRNYMLSKQELSEYHTEMQKVVSEGVAIDLAKLRETVDGMAKGNTVGEIENYDRRYQSVELGDKINISKLYKDINVESYKDMVSKLSQSQLDTLVSSVEGEKTGFFGNSSLKSILESYGYKPDGIFDSDEAKSIVSLLKNLKETQDSFSGLGLEDRVRRLFDVDRDNVLEAGDKHFNLGESQMFANMMGGGSEDLDRRYNNLLTTLGYDRASFENSLKNNYFATHEKFVEDLRKLPSSYVAFGAILEGEKGITEFTDKQFELQDEMMGDIEASIDERILGSEKIQEALRGLDPASRESMLDKIKLEGIGILVGCYFGVGASFNISEATDGWLDSMQVGVIMVGGIPVPGIGVSKSWEVADGKVVFTQSIINLIPILTVTGKVYEPDPESKGLYSNEIKGGGYEKSINLPLLFDVIPLGVGINFNQVDGDSAAGMEKVVDNFKVDLDDIFNKIAKGQGIEQTEYYQRKLQEPGYEGSKEQALDKKTFKEIEHFCNLYKGDNAENKELYMASLENGYANSYRNELYRAKIERDGNTEYFTQAGLFMLLGVIPIPTVGYEHISQNYDKTSDMLTMAESIITTKETTLEGVNGRFENYNGKKALFFEGLQNISTKDFTKVQAEKTDAGMYLSGDLEGLEVKVVKWRDNRGEKDVLVVGDAMRRGTALEVNNMKDIKPITSDISGKGEKTEVQYGGLDKVLEKENESIENTREVRNILSQVIDRTAVDKDNTGIKELQVLINQYENGSGNLDDAWNKLKRMISSEKGNNSLNMHIYYRMGNSQAEYNAFRSLIGIDRNGNETKTWNDTDKSLILREILSNSMKDNYMRDKLVSREEHLQALERLGNELLKVEGGKAFKEEIDSLGAKDLSGWENAYDNIKLSEKYGDLGRQYIHASIPLDVMDNINIAKAGIRNDAFERQTEKYLSEGGEILDIDLTNERNAIYEALGDDKSYASPEVQPVSTDSMVVFPVSAQLGGGLRGVTPMTGIIELATGNNGEPLMVSVDDKGVREALVDKLPDKIINGIVNILKSAGYNFPDGSNESEVVKNMLKTGEKINGVQILGDVFFCKWGKCWNDALGLKDLRIVGEGGEEFKIGISSANEVRFAENDKLGVSITYAKCVSCEDKKEPDMETDPDVVIEDIPVESPSMSTDPNADITGSGNSGGLAGSGTSSSQNLGGGGFNNGNNLAGSGTSSSQNLGGGFSH